MMQYHHFVAPNELTLLSNKHQWQTFSLHGLDDKYVRHCKLYTVSVTYSPLFLSVIFNNQHY